MLAVQAFADSVIVLSRRPEGAANLMPENINVLFICSRNQWRSPTAEQLWRRHPMFSARSAGTSPNARHHVSVEDARWADVILVMEEKHKSRLVAEFTRSLDKKPIHVLDIPDEYKFMDPELVEMPEQSVNSILGLSELKHSDITQDIIT